MEVIKIHVSRGSSCRPGYLSVFACELAGLISKINTSPLQLHVWFVTMVAANNNSKAVYEQHL